jgi:hypothetical protein
MLLSTACAGVARPTASGYDEEALDAVATGGRPAPGLLPTLEHLRHAGQGP